MAYAFMSIEKVKTLSAMSGKMNHNYRLSDVSNADPNRASWNEEIIQMKDDSYVDAYNRKISESDYYKVTKVRKDAVKGMEIMMTFNQDEVENDFDLDGWKKANVQWLQDRFGKDNVISAVCHMDEHSPHIHGMVIPMVNGKLNCKHFLTNRKKMIELQNSYGEAMKPFGLKRGIQKSQAKHEDIKRFYGSVNAAISSDLPEISMGENGPETAKEYRERVNEYYKDVRLKHLNEIKKMERKIVEAKSYNISETIEQKELKNRLDEAETKIEKYEEIEKEFGTLPQIRGKLTTLHQLNDGKSEYATAHPEEKNSIYEMGLNMQKVIKWKRKKDSAKKTKKQLEIDKINKEEYIIK